METGWCHSPTEHDYEVHDVPAIPQVGTFMENKPQRHQLYPRLEAEDADEVRLCLLLRGGHNKNRVSRAQGAGRSEVMNYVLTLHRRHI